MEYKIIDRTKTNEYVIFKEKNTTISFIAYNHITDTFALFSSFNRFHHDKTIRVFIVEVLNIDGDRIEMGLGKALEHGEKLSDNYIELDDIMTVEYVLGNKEFIKDNIDLGLL